MPDLRPFHGIRYSSPERLAELVCPPYDVITEDEQIRLHDRHPRNAVRLELARGGAGPERYRNVAAEFRSWLGAGDLARDPRPCLYVYRQDFAGPSGGRAGVTGIIGELALEPWGHGVLPHEQTMEGPKADRLALLEACPVNISPIYAVYRGGGSLQAYFETLAVRPPAARFADADGILHRLWAIEGAAEIDLLSEALRDSPLVVADGHHRYETALEFAARPDGPQGRMGIMCFCVDADAEDLCVLPYHRALKVNASGSELRVRIESRFGGKELDPAESGAALDASEAEHPLLFAFGDADLLVELSDGDVVERVGDRPRAWRDLDVVALHEVVLAETAGDIAEIAFSTHEERVRDLVASGWSAAVLLRPLSPAAVVDAARSGQRMPQKASYFWPKAVTGLVFREL